jgi:predicted HTH transcriptional regulator
MTTYDREPVLDATIEDLDLVLVFSTMRRGLELGRFTVDDVPKLTAEQLRVGHEDAAYRYLESFSGAVWVGEGEQRRLVPTVAGVLSFTRTPGRWVMSSGVDVGIFQDDRRTLPGQLSVVPSPTRARVLPVRGPIFSVIDRTVELLRDACSTQRLEGARLVPALEIPLNVLRELTANGVVHRDLQLDGELVRVQVFPSMVEWLSPGRLPPEKFPENGPVSVELLLEAQFARNPALAMFLFHGGYIEKFGFGLDDVVATLAEIGQEEPKFNNSPTGFSVKVRRLHIELPPEVPAPPAYDPHALQRQRQERIIALFTEQETWTPRQIEQRLQIPRNTLQKDLTRMTTTGMLLASGATNSRVYRLASSESEPAERLT